MSPGLKLALLLGGLALLGLLVALIEPTPTLRHVRVGLLSGNERGNYYAVVGRLAAEAQRQKGRSGICRRLAPWRIWPGSRRQKPRATSSSRSSRMASTGRQDGKLEVVGRMVRPETLVFLGPAADRITRLEDLRGARIGIGPVGSGTEQLVRHMIAPFADLDLKVSTPTTDEQLAQLQRGELDLGAMVIDEDARLIDEAVQATQAADPQHARGPRASPVAFRLLGSATSKPATTTSCTSCHPRPRTCCASTP